MTEELIRKRLEQNIINLYASLESFRLKTLNIYFSNADFRVFFDKYDKIINEKSLHERLLQVNKGIEEVEAEGKFVTRIVESMKRDIAEFEINGTFN